MLDWAINLGLLLVAAFAIVNGLLMLIAPPLHRKFLNRIMYADSWSQPAPSAPRGREIESRVVGLIIACIGAYFAWSAISGLRIPKPATPDVQSVLSLANSRMHLFLWILGFASLAAGTYISLKPDVIVDWSIRHQPIPREIHDSTRHTWTISMRLLGTVLGVGGLYTLWTFLH
jgi:hypothetical protein